MSTPSEEPKVAAPAPENPAVDGKKKPAVVICIGSSELSFLPPSLRLLPFVLLPARSNPTSSFTDECSPLLVALTGMAGSGKTTLMQRLNSHLHAQKTPPYIVNLDPAVTHMPFTANIDIRDTVDYKEVMKQ